MTAQKAHLGNTGIEIENVIRLGRTYKVNVTKFVAARAANLQVLPNATGAVAGQSHE